MKSSSRKDDNNNNSTTTTSPIRNVSLNTTNTTADWTTIVLCCCARFASAVARLSLGPLLPILSVQIFYNNILSVDDKSMLLSAYSTGYLLTQIVGGVAADRYGAIRVVSICCGISSILLSSLTLFLSNVQSWRCAYFCLGVVAGPLFPACQTAAARQSAMEPAQALAWMDTAAAVGATLAAASPLLPSAMFFYLMTSALLLLVSVTALRHNANNRTTTVLWRLTSTTNNNTNSNHTDGSTNHLTNSDNKKSYIPTTTRLIRDVFQSHTSSSWKVYVCHSVDNFTKYSINAWAVTILIQHYGASAGTAGIILGAHEGLTVVSRLFWVNYGATYLFASSPPHNNNNNSSNSNSNNANTTIRKKLLISALAFCWQGIGYQFFFYAHAKNAGGPGVAAALLTLTAIAAGMHSIGFRTCYTSGASAGLGNTIASIFSIAGNMAVPYHRQYCFLLANLMAAMIAAMSSTIVSAGSMKWYNRRKHHQQKQIPAGIPRSSATLWTTIKKEPEA